MSSLNASRKRCPPMHEPTYAAITPADYAELRALWDATPGMGLGAADSAAGIAALLALFSGDLG